MFLKAVVVHGDFVGLFFGLFETMAGDRIREGADISILYRHIESAISTVSHKYLHRKNYVTRNNSNISSGAPKASHQRSE